MKSETGAGNLASVNKIGIESYGVRIGIETDMDPAELKRRLSKILPNGFKEIQVNSVEHNFLLARNKTVFELYKNKERITEADSTELIFDQFESQLRITVAEFAVEKVFLHAGVVGWKGKAIIIPAKSFQGKTTLVAELVKKGAAYYSDEYAVLDENGFVHPFPKMLSMRGIIDNFTQLDLPVESLGGTAGTEPIPVAMVLITEYRKNAKWKPERLSVGRGIMEILSHTIPIRHQPEFSLKVLNKMVNRAVITKTRRGEAAETANLLLDFFEKQAIEF